MSDYRSRGAKLPLESQSLDILSISYGIRNVVERQKALSELLEYFKRWYFGSFGLQKEKRVDL